MGGGGGEGAGGCGHALAACKYSLGVSSGEAGVGWGVGGEGAGGCGHAWAALCKLGVGSGEAGVGWGVGGGGGGGVWVRTGSQWRGRGGMGCGRGVVRARGGVGTYWQPLNTF